MAEGKAVVVAAAVACALGAIGKRDPNLGARGEEVAEAEQHWLHHHHPSSTAEEPSVADKPQRPIVVGIVLGYRVHRTVAHRMALRSAGDGDGDTAVVVVAAEQRPQQQLKDVRILMPPQRLRGDLSSEVQLPSFPAVCIVYYRRFAVVHKLNVPFVDPEVDVVVFVAVAKVVGEKLDDAEVVAAV